MKYFFNCLSTFIFNLIIKQTLHYTFLCEHNIPFCDVYHCTVFDAKPCIIMLLRLILKGGLVSHIGVLMNNLPPKKNCSRSGGGAWYA